MTCTERKHVCPICGKALIFKEPDYEKLQNADIPFIRNDIDFRFVCQNGHCFDDTPGNGFTANKRLCPGRCGKYLYSK